MPTYNEIFLNSLLKGDRAKCSEIVHNKLDEGMPFIEVYESLIKTSMYEIGELWE